MQIIIILIEEQTLSFHRYLKSLTSTFNEITDETLDILKAQADGGTTKVPLKNIIMKMASDIISKVLNSIVENNKNIVIHYYLSSFESGIQ